MKLKYSEYIKNLNLHQYEAYGNCKQLCEDMLSFFPSLSLVRGHYYCSIWGERMHWWLTDGIDIIDPSAIQFPSLGKGVYIPWIEGSPEPTGICPNCGEYCWSGEQVHQECESAFIASLMG